MTVNHSQRAYLFEQVIENSFDSSWVLSFPSLKLKYVNKTTEKLLGYSLRRYFEDPDFWFSIIVDEDKILATEANNRCLKDGVSEARYRMVCADNRTIWVLVRLRLIKNTQGNPIMLIGNSMDITEATIQEQQLKDSIELFHSLATFSPSGIFKTDIHGSCTYLNKVWFNITGNNWEESKGDGWLRSIHPDDKLRVITEWKLATSQGSNFSCQFRFVNPTKGIRHVFSRAGAVTDTEGKITGFVGTIEDITERIQAEETLNIQREKLLTSAKMSSLGEMASGIAHEINGPLTVIIGMCSKIRRVMNKTPVDFHKMDVDLSKIELTSFRIARIIKGLKAFSRNAENDPMESIPIMRPIEDALEICKDRFKQHSVDLRVEMQEISDLKIEARPAQITQVILNLLGNAFDAVEGYEDRWVEIGIMRLKDNVRIKVKDCGNGISKEVLEKIMDPFFTTKEVGKGTGLGLSISKGIISDHKGMLFYDHESKNTCFVIELPLISQGETEGKS